MINYFNDGFSEKSYFAICKEIVTSTYKNRISNGELQFLFSDEDEVNAFASLNGDQDVLVINAKTVVDIYALMKTAFSQKYIFCRIGHPKNESNLLVEGKFIPFMKNCMFTATPNGQDRDTISLYAALFALSFIYRHELGHIINGHTKYLHTLYMNSEISMRVKSFACSRSYALDRRTLEMDADAAAATSSFDNVAMLYQNKSDEIPIKLLKSREEIFGIWSFAICSVFLLFERGGKSDYDADSFYLPNEARFKMIMLSAYETAKSYVKHGIVPELEKNKDKIISEVIYGICEAEKLFRNKYYLSVNWSSSIFKPSGLYSIYSNEVNEHWNKKLRKSLKKFARAPLYDPDRIDEIIERIKMTK